MFATEQLWWLSRYNKKPACADVDIQYLCADESLWWSLGSELVVHAAAISSWEVLSMQSTRPLKWEPEE